MARKRKSRFQTHRAIIEDIAHDGRGVARVEGKTMFVHGALPGEDVTFTTYKRKRSFEEAVTDEVHEASPLRVEPKCAAFGLCGGCVLQHLDDSRQRDHKRDHLKHDLTHIGGVTPEHWLDDLSASPWNYRRRGRLGVKDVPGKGRVMVGFRERKTPYIADMHQCEILAKPVGTMLEKLSEVIGQLSVRSRLPQIELAVGDDATALVLRILDPISEKDGLLLHKFASAENVDIYLQTGGPNTVAPLSEARPLEYALPEFDVTVRFEPLDFVQVNGPLNAAMISHVIKHSELRPGDRVLDLYCGLGNFSLPLARCVDHVTGVEGDVGLVKRAEENAARNGITNTDFHVANLFEPEPQWSWLQNDYDVVLIDPPRAGSLEMLPLISKLKPRVIAYVSCHPATLARDAAELVKEYGYVLSKAGIMDMFPHTGHVESVAIFVRA
ncbi:MAG: 23S rRNA (uracil(1939)-C(5))-methyltransferase RlmD [Gammaproteobacteria bacterium]